MDSLDFVPLEEDAGFYGITAGMRDAFPDKEAQIEGKEKRHQEATLLVSKLAALRPSLKKLENKEDPLVLKFIWQEYYHFWREDKRNLLSNTHFTYLHQIKKMSQNVDALPAAILSYGYFEAEE